MVAGHPGLRVHAPSPVVVKVCKLILGHVTVLHLRMEEETVMEHQTELLLALPAHVSIDELQKHLVYSTFLPKAYWIDLLCWYDTFIFTCLIRPHV